MDRGGRRTRWVSRRRRLACRSSGSRLVCSSLHPLEQLGHFRAEDAKTDFRRRHALFENVAPASPTSSAESTREHTAHASSSLFTMLRPESEWEPRPATNKPEGSDGRKARSASEGISPRGIAQPRRTSLSPLDVRDHLVHDLQRGIIE